jgi:hypothetical protein
VAGGGGKETFKELFPEQASAQRIILKLFKTPSLP